MGRVHLLQARGKKPTDAGFTFLEIGLAIFLAFVLVSSFFYIKRSHSTLKQRNACEESRWRWISFLEEAHWRVKKWEMLAPSCLRAGYRPMHQQGGLVTFSELSSRTVLSEQMKSPNELRVLPGHEFLKGQEILICGENALSKRTIEQLTIGNTQSLLEFDSALNLQELWSKGETVVSLTNIEFELKQETKDSKFFYRKLGPNQYKPLFTDVAHASFTVSQDLTTYSFQLGSGEKCSASQEFTINPSSSMPGRWHLNGGLLEFEPWVYPGGQAS